MTTIIGVKTIDRVENAVLCQSVLTKFGCIIKTRIGLHDKVGDVCSPDGIIILEVINDAQSKELLNALCEIDGIELQEMIF